MRAAATATAVVALKRWRDAKSRLRGLPDPLRRRLAWTMAIDTLSALGETVPRLVVVSDQPGLSSRLQAAGVITEVVAESGGTGINAALARGAQHAVQRGAAVVLACVGDLPALRPATVQVLLEAALAFPRSFLADQAGTGTTMLIANRAALDPRFGTGSAKTHRASGAAPLADRLGPGAVPDARHDVDTEADLAVVTALGLRRATASLIDPATGTVGRYCEVRVIGAKRVISDAGAELAMSWTVYDPGGLPGDSNVQAQPLAMGLRLHAVVSVDRVLSAWPITES